MSRSAPAPPVYLDTSVLVALAAPDDARHAASTSWLAHHPLVVTSVVAEVELGRALSRRRAPAQLRSSAHQLLAGCEVVELTADIRSAAIGILPASIRSLDAIHVATALAAGVSQFVTFDVRQRVAAEEAGLTAVTL